MTGAVKNVVNLFNDKPKRALVVDDVALTRAVTRVFLETAGCNVVEMRAISEACGEHPSALTLALGEVRLFDLVVLKIAEEPAEQIALIHALKVHALRGMKMICTVSISHKDTVFSLFEAGADVIIVRPYNPTVLVGAVTRCLSASTAKYAGRGKSAMISREKEMLVSYWPDHNSAELPALEQG